MFIAAAVVYVQFFRLLARVKQAADGNTHNQWKKKVYLHRRERFSILSLIQFRNDSLTALWFNDNISGRSSTVVVVATTRLLYWTNFCLLKRKEKLKRTTR